MRAGIGWRRGFKPERGAVGAARAAGAGAAAQVREPEGSPGGSGECGADRNGAGDGLGGTEGSGE